MAIFSISQIAAKVTQEKLAELFAPFSGVVTKFDNKSPWNITARVEVPDARAEEAFKATNKKMFEGKQLKVEGKIPPPSAAQAQPKLTASEPKPPAAALVPTTKVTPYRFVRRNRFAMKETEAHHDQLAAGRFDVAFEVNWRTITPVAANPCNDPDVDETFPRNDNNHYQGFNKRWLIVDNRLALSPFTVKGALANGFANLIGGCYRVTDRAEKHPDNADREKYNYNGAYKRYRVVMSNSKPGILSSINFDTGEVVIEKVTEYFYDSPNPPAGMEFVRDMEYFGVPQNIRHKLVLNDGSLFNANCQGAQRLRYFGPYTFGMELTFGPGDFRKNHYHRFYSSAGTSTSGKISTINLKSLDEQKKHVYMGVFEKLADSKHHDRRQGLDGGPWHQNLHNLKAGDWVYYQEFNGKVTAIGRNFQFKTAFEHSDAVPEGQELCRDKNHLCPRCALFGMVDEVKQNERRDDKSPGGFRGRFKASALVCDLPVTAEPLPGVMPGGGSVAYVAYRDAEGGLVARQILLPLMGSPKPNKRDVANGGYFEKGFVRGAKEYLHSGHTLDTFTDQVEKQVNRWQYLRDLHGPTAKGGEMPYNHDLRGYGVVCRDKLTFAGTVGVENASTEEVATLVVLLHQQLADQGFKIGLGKSVGLGSMASTIKKIWVRHNESYQWESITLNGSAKIHELLDEKIPGIKAKIDDLVKAQKEGAAYSRRDPLKSRQGRTPYYPAPGQDYWKNMTENA